MTTQINFYGMDEKLDNYYNLDDFVSFRLMFTYESYVERDGDKESKFLSGDVVIEDHWLK